MNKNIDRFGYQGDEGLKIITSNKEEIKKSIPNSDFNFFVPIDEDELEKASKQTGAGRYKNMFVQGVASDASEDSDGETLIPTGYELERFKKYGFINYDHRSKDNPKYYIGEPLDASVQGNKFFVKGKLYEHSPIARDLWDTMILLKKSNSTRKVGWSIEGKALERDRQNPKLIKRALITGVALTMQPKNTNSYAEITKGNYKSSYVDYDYDDILLEKSEANGGKVTYLVDIVDNDRGIRYTIDKDLNLKVEKAISTTTAQPLIKEDLEGKVKKLPFGADDIKNIARAKENGQISNELLPKIKEKIRKAFGIDIEKAKYIRREGTKGNYKYIYSEEGSGGKGGKKVENKEEGNKKKDLTHEEMESVNDYTSSNYRKINKELRNPPPSEETQIKIDNINNAIDKLPKFKGELYRGMSLPSNIDKLLEEWQKGNAIKMDSFTSTSIDNKVSKSFGDFQIKLISKGKNGADISSLSGLEEEKEVLFKSGTNFKVKSIKVKKLKTPFGEKVVSVDAVLEEI